MKELLKKLGFEHFPMLSEFVKAVNKLETLTKFFQINRYTDFITQPLTKGMFIPCDEKGDVLELAYSEDYMRSHKVYHYEVKQYQQAVDRVLFEGWELCGSIGSWLWDGSTQQLELPIKYKTIEQAINAGVKFKFKQL